MNMEKNRKGEGIVSPKPVYETGVAGTERYKSREPVLEAYSRAYSAEERALGKLPASGEQMPLSIRNKAANFVKEHTGLDYNDFLTRFGTDRVNITEKPNNKRDSYETRVGLVLASLADVEKRGYDINPILREIGKRVDITSKFIFGLFMKGKDPKEVTFNMQMAELLRKTYSGEIHATDLRKEGYDLIRRVMDEDSEGYCGDNKYLVLKEVQREIDNLHDDCTPREVEETMQYLQKLEKKLKQVTIQ
jgi:hypothetical protein